MSWKALPFLFVVATACVAVGDRVNAQTRADDTATLKSRIERRFEILPLKEGALLRPRERRSFSAVEVSSGAIAVDGKTVSGSELRTALGADADLVLQLSYLNDADRRALLGQAADSQPRVERDTPPAEPVPDELRGRRDRRSSRGSHEGDRVRIGGGIDVESDEVVDGNVVAIGGPARIDGVVHGDVVAVGGGITLGPQASVDEN